MYATRKVKAVDIGVLSHRVLTASIYIKRSR
jgi:hypothetical protein